MAENILYTNSVQNVFSLFFCLAFLVLKKGKLTFQLKKYTNNNQFKKKKNQHNFLNFFI